MSAPGAACAVPVTRHQLPEPNDEPHGRKADEAVDHAGEPVRLAELEAGDLRDEVELRERDEAPVQGPHDRQPQRQDVQFLHLSPSPQSVEVLSRVRIGDAPRACQGSVEKSAQMLYGSAMREPERYLRIGELARRTGTSPELLRAWEQRYGLLRPSRSAGGFRLYSDDDTARILRTKQLIASGLSAGEAARQAGTRPAVA